jgi:predicted aspartyl protease
MSAYNQTWFDPPAPVALVTLRHHETGAKLADVPMLLDSGADITLVPATAVQAIGVTLFGQEYELTGYDDKPTFSSAVYLELIWDKRTFRGRYAVMEQTYGIIGRNLLNFLSLHLDGPKLSWWIR